MGAFKCNKDAILPYVIFVDEYYDSSSVVLRAQTFDYSVEVLRLGVPQNLLANCDADVVLRRKGNEASDALKAEFQPQINCLSIGQVLEF